MSVKQVLTIALLALLGYASPTQNRKTCTIKASGTNRTDDAPAIRAAFKECGHRGMIVFEPTTYYVNSVLNITDLEDVDIDIQGELLVSLIERADAGDVADSKSQWSTNIQYWLNASLPVGYQNQSTAFILGGNNVRIDGHGVGTFNGNGDYWYQWIKKQSNTSNYPGRPHQITFNGLTNSVVKGLRFLRSQMWTMSIIYSYDSIWQDIFVNNTGNIVSSCKSPRLLQCLLRHQTYMFPSQH